MKATAIWMPCDISIMCRRLRRSATTPPISVNSRIGSSPTKESRPRKNAEADAGERDDEPGLGDLLHPCADARRERAEPEEAKVAVGQGNRDAECGLDSICFARGSILCELVDTRRPMKNIDQTTDDGSWRILRASASGRPWRPASCGRACRTRARDGHPRDGHRRAQAVRRRADRGGTQGHGRVRQSQPDAATRNCARSRSRSDVSPPFHFSPVVPGMTGEQDATAVPAERRAVRSSVPPTSRTSRSGRSATSPSSFARDR